MIEAALDRRLIHPRPTFFFGPADGAIADYAAAVARAGAEASGGIPTRAGAEGKVGIAPDARSGIVSLTPGAARRICPSLRCGDDDLVLQDLGGGFIAAAETVAGLAGWLRTAGAELYEHTRVEAIIPGADPLAVATDRGTLLAERLVVAAGAWTGRLLPWLAPRMTVLRQTVGYFRTAGDAGGLPVWARIGRPGEPFVYGLPAFGHPGLKAAIHRTTGAPDDPDDDPPGRSEPGAGQTEIDMLHRLVSRYCVAALGVDHVETCLYAMLPDDAFLLDLHPEDPRIVIALCCSGHAFKLGPLTGRIAADLALDGRSDVAAYALHRARFGVG